VFAKLAQAATSTMAKGVFNWVARGTGDGTDTPS
jgi:hypothetical protein